MAWDVRLISCRVGLAGRPPFYARGRVQVPRSEQSRRPSAAEPHRVLRKDPKSLSAASKASSGFEGSGAAKNRMLQD